MSQKKDSSEWRSKWFWNRSLKDKDHNRWQVKWKNKKPIYGKSKYYSISRKLRRENKSNDEFEIMLSNLTLEDVIGLKLELASKTIGGKLFGLPLWSSVDPLVKEAILKYALSAARSINEAAAFIGLSKHAFYKYQRLFDVESFFGEEDGS